MHQRRGLQGLCRRLVGHLVRGQSAELSVNERQEPLGGVFALLNSLKNLSDVAHGSRFFRDQPFYLRLFERTLVAGNYVQAFNRRLVSIAHLDRVGNRAKRLLPQRTGANVPEEMRVESPRLIDERRRFASAFVSATGF